MQIRIVREFWAIAVLFLVSSCRGGDYYGIPPDAQVIVKITREVVADIDSVLYIFGKDAVVSYGIDNAEIVVTCPCYIGGKTKTELSNASNVKVESPTLTLLTLQGAPYDIDIISLPEKKAS